MKAKLIIKLYWPYILPAAMYTLWQSSVGWLNTAWTQVRLGNYYTTLNFILFFTAHALGTALFALRLEKPVSSERLLCLALGSALLTGLLTALMAIWRGPWLLLLSVLTGLAASFYPALFGTYLLRRIHVGHRGSTLTAASALGIALHYLIFTLVMNSMTGAALYVSTLLTAAVFLLVGLLALLLPACRDRLWAAEAPVKVETEPLPKLRARKRLIPPLAMLLILFYSSYGIHDFAATASWMNGGDFLEHTRLFLIAGFMLCGFLWDRRYGSVLFSVSFGLLALGFIAMAQQYKGAAAFVGVTGIQLASAFFTVCLRLVFIEIAGFFKRPVFTTSLGFALPLLFKQAGLLTAAMVYSRFGGTALFIISLVGVALGLPLMMLLFERIREVNVLDVQARQPILTSSAEKLCENAPDDSDTITMRDSEQDKVSSNLTSVFYAPLSQEYGFTRREGQLLELAMRGLTNIELAQRMGISQATVKYHIRNILMKTDAKNMKQLICREAEKDKSCSVTYTIRVNDKSLP